ncbi:hypothetical protein [Thiorhodococcus drewsii]|uniref:hypothetical protein n=1 Tax=Thiorhodococcus drewsii TaxID=210408 RepID=UPI001C1DFB1B|nr:hypothetical protein [Thiorhodococcus drewsii]
MPQDKTGKTEGRDLGMAVKRRDRKREKTKRQKAGNNPGLRFSVDPFDSADQCAIETDPLEHAALHG